MAITMVRTLKTQQRPDRGHKTEVTHCRACNVLLIEHNHGCQWDDLKQVPITPDTTPDISATIADIENHLLSDYERYRDMLMELKALPPGIAHADRDTENNAIENLKLEERKPVDYTLPTSGLVAGQPYKVDNTLTWEENIKNWENREPIPYPEGYTQGIVLFEDDKPIYKTECINDKCKFKTLVKFEKVKKTRKVKTGVC